MRKKELLKLTVGISLVAVMAIAIPLMSGCAAPAPEPTPTPTPEPTPTPTPEPAVEEPTWHFRGISCQAPPIVQRDSVEQLCDVITRMSAGRITFDWFSGGEIMPSEEEVSALQAGTIDMLQWFPALGTVTDLRDIEAGMPFMTQDALEFQTLIDYRGLGELFKESYEELGGIHYIGNALHDPQDIASAKPLETLDDFDGLKLQVMATQAPPFAAIGASCVWHPVDEIYMAGKTGIVDAFFGCGADELYDWGLHEVYTYIVTPAIVDPCNVAYLINKDQWDSLPDDLQAVIYYAVRHNNLWCQQIRHQGESADRHHFTGGVSVLDDECLAALYEASMDYLDEMATRSPRCAEAVRIIKEYHEEVEAAGWHR